MKEPSTGGFEFQINDRSNPGGRVVASSASGRNILYFLLMMPGVFFCLNAMGIYPPLDSRPPRGLMLSLFLLPVAAHLAFTVLKPASTAAGPWKTLYSSASAALVVFAIALYLNGGLDRSPVNQMTTTVIRKSVYHGRRGTRYYLAVASWRPGKTLEHFGVVKSVYDHAQVGKTAAVEIHQGFFGLAWHGPISPE